MEKCEQRGVITWVAIGLRGNHRHQYTNASPAIRMVLRCKTLRLMPSNGE